MPSSASHDISLVFAQVEAGELARSAGFERLFDLVYPELRGIAQRHLSKERAGHTLQPTALIHEAYLRLFDSDQLSIRSRVQFLAIVARVMRQVLIDHARRRAAGKRGGGWHRVSLVSGVFSTDHPLELDLIALDSALTELAREDTRCARVVELKLFGGLSVPEMAQVLEVSQRTVKNDWAMARMWLTRALELEG